MSARRARILVIGNGPTGIDRDGAVHVDRGCGHFLEELARYVGVTFAQPVEAVDSSLNYYGHVLEGARVQALLLDRSTVGRALFGALALVRAIVRADLVYLFFPGTLPRLAWRMCRLMGKPYALFLRGSQFDESGTDGPLFARARFVFCVSETLSAQVSRLNPNTFVVRSAQDLRAEDAWHRPVANAGAPLNLLYVGRIDEEKGVPELVDAARALYRDGFEFRLVLVGFGRLGTQIEREIAETVGLPVAYLGAVEDRSKLLELFRASDIFILPSHHEGFARVLYEAMLQSCAIISTMVGGIPAVLKDEENCLAIPVGHAGAIALAVRRLADDPALRARIAKNGHNTVLEIIERIPRHADAFLDLIVSASPVSPTHQRGLQE